MAQPRVFKASPDQSSTAEPYLTSQQVLLCSNSTFSVLSDAPGEKGDLTNAYPAKSGFHYLNQPITDGLLGDVFLFVAVNNKLSF